MDTRSTLTADEVVARYGALFAERSNINETYERIAQFVIPQEGRFWETMSDQELAIQWRHRYLYDSTAVTSAQTLAAHIHGALTSPAMRWFNLRFQQDWLNDNLEAMTWLEECQDIIWFNLIESNFNLEANEFYLDLVTFGTAVMAHESTPDGKFKFKTYMLRGCYFEEDFDGNPASIYRQKQFTALQLWEQFPDTIPEDIMKQAKSATNCNTMHSVIHVIRKRDFATVDLGSVLPPKRRPVEERFVLQKGAFELLKEPLTYYEMPAYVSKWAKQAGSKFGYSPAMNVLSDILTLNQLVELILRAAEKVIDPPILAPDRGVFGDIDLKPGGITVVRDPKMLIPFESRARFDVSQLQRETLQRQVRDAFFIDQLQIKESPESTATEINARMSLMQRLLGPALSRIESNFLEPLINRSFRILHRAEKLPPAPPVVMENNAEMAIEYLGPMSRGMKQEEVNSIDRMLMTVQNLVPMVPEIAQIVNWDECFRTMAARLGVPARILRTRDEVSQMREQQQKQQQQMQQAQYAEQMAGAMKDGAAANKDMVEAGGMGGDLGI